MLKVMEKIIALLCIGLCVSFTIAVLVTVQPKYKPDHCPRDDGGSGHYTVNNPRGCNE